MIVAVTSDEQAFLISGHRIRVFVGDLAALPVAVDGIVSSDDNYLSHGGGVSRALWQKAGHQLRDFAGSSKPPLRLGDAWVSPAFELNARVLVHAVSIDLDQNRTITEAELPALYLRLFETLATAKCETVGLPLLGAGAAGIAPRASATAFIDALTSGLPAYAGVTGFILAIRSDADSKAIDVLRDAHERDRDIERDLAEIVSLMPGEEGDSLRKAWERYVLGDPDTRGPALALLLGHLSDLQERFPGVADDALVEHLAREAAMARNRMAHSRAGVNAHDWGTLLSAVRATVAAARRRIERGPSRPSPIVSRSTVGAGEAPPPFDLSSESD